MSSATIIRAFKAQPSQMINEATKLANSSAYAVKKFFYNLVTLGCGKAIQEARATRREKEIASMAENVLQNLPTDYSKSTTDTTPKELHTNMNEKYQIILEDNKLCLYTGTVSHSWFGSGNSTFKKDLASREVLKTISSDEDLTKLKTELTMVKEYNELSQNNKSTFAKELIRAKAQKDDLKQDTQKTDIVFYGNGGKFNPAWENHLTHITAINYQIEEIEIDSEQVYKVFNHDNPTQHILIVANAQSNKADRKLIDQQISEFFKQKTAGTLEDFLNQPVAVNDSSKYRVLKNGYEQNMKFGDNEHLYPLFEYYLDNY